MLRRSTLYYLCITILFLHSVLVTDNIVPSLLIPFSLMIEVKCSSETWVLTRARQCHVSEHDILHNHYHENLKSHITLTGWALWRRGMFPARYELGFYIPENGILHSHCRENLKSYIALTSWAS
jgi:hypothetical protein